MSDQRDLGGKKATELNSGSGSKVSGAKATPKAESSDKDSSGNSKPLQVAAAIAVTISVVDQTALLPDGLAIGAPGATGALTLSAKGNTDSTAKAEGKAVASTGGSSANTIGAAVAVNLAFNTTKASIGNGATVYAGSLTLESRTQTVGTDSTNTYGAEATSGAGGGKNSVAGSLAFNLVLASSTAAIGNAAIVTLAGATPDVTLTADPDSASTTKALAGEASGTAFGLGLSIAVSVVDDTTAATIGDEAIVNGARTLTLSATGGHSSVVEATNGAKATAAGGDAVTPVVAVAISIVSTKATIGMQVLGTLTTTGAISVSATQSASVSSKATGASTAPDNAIGFSLGFTLALHSVEATTHRSLSAGGAISFTALGASAATSEATASAKGAAAEDDSSRDKADGSGKKSVDSDIADQRDLGGKKATELNSGSGSKVSGAKPTPKAESSEKNSSGDSKPLQVAAAIAVTISDVSQKATIPAGLSINAGTATLTLSAKGNTDSTAKASGQAVAATGGTSANTIGAAVGVNLAFLTTEASIGNGATINAGSLTLESRTQTVGADSANTFGAEATSGAGGGKNSIAGSLAFNLVLASSTASLGNGAMVALSGGSGDVSLIADPDSVSTTKALSGGASGTKFGLGLSIAVSVVIDTTSASIGDAATLTGAHNLLVSAIGGHQSIVEAENGAKAPSGDAITPVIAVAISIVDTKASIGVGTALLAGGTLTLHAEQSASASAKATGSANASGAAVGFSIAFTLALHSVSATTGRSLSAGGAVTFEALGVSGAASEAKASAAGAADEDSTSRDKADGTGKKSVDSDVADQRDLGGKKAGEVGGTGGASKVSGAKATPKAESSDKDSSGNSKPLQVAAAIAVTISDVSQKATLPAGLAISSGTALTKFSAKGNTDSTAKADGSATTTGPATGTSVGAAVGVNLAFLTTEASIGAGAHVSAGALTLESLTQTVGADSANTFGAEATSGAGGGKNSIAGSLAFNLVLASSNASVGDGATVALAGGTGDVSLTADPDSVSTTKALSAGATGAKFGLGLSIAVSVVIDTTTASIGDLATLTGAHNLLVSATGGHQSIVEAENGAKTTGAGGDAITPVVAVAISIVDTKAAIGLGFAPLVSTGTLTVHADQSASASAKATGSANASGAAVGFSIGFTLALHSVSATTGRSLTSGGAMTFEALGVSGAASEAKASAAGAADEDSTSRDKADGSGKKSVDSDVADQRGLGQKKAGEVGGTDGSSKVSGAKATPKAESSDKDGSGNSKPVQVAAAIAVTISVTSQKVTIPGALVLNAGSNALRLTAKGNTDSTATADGSATTTGPATGTSVGAAIAVNLAFVTTEASVGNGTTITAASLTIESKTQTVGLDSTNTFGAQSTSGAGGGKNSIAGSVSFNLVEATSTASVGTGVAIALSGGTGDVTISADPDSVSTTKALSAGATGAKFGLGLSIAVSIVLDDVAASVGDGTTLSGVHPQPDHRRERRAQPRHRRRERREGHRGHRGHTRDLGQLLEDHLDGVPGDRSPDDPHRRARRDRSAARELDDQGDRRHDRERHRGRRVDRPDDLDPQRGRARTAVGPRGRRHQHPGTRLIEQLRRGLRLPRRGQRSEQEPRQLAEARRSAGAAAARLHRRQGQLLVRRRLGHDQLWRVGHTERRELREGRRREQEEDHRRRGRRRDRRPQPPERDHRHRPDRPLDRRGVHAARHRQHRRGLEGRRQRGEDRSEDRHRRRCGDRGDLRRADQRGDRRRQRTDRRHRRHDRGDADDRWRH